MHGDAGPRMSATGSPPPRHEPRNDDLVASYRTASPKSLKFIGTTNTVGKMLGDNFFWEREIW
jgi:hypothetical protein